MQSHSVSRRPGAVKMAVIRLFCLVFYFLIFRFLLITVNATFSLKFTDKVNLNDTALMGDNIQFVVSALGHSLFSARLTRAPSGELLRNYWREKSTNNPFPCIAIVKRRNYFMRCSPSIMFRFFLSVNIISQRVVDVYL